MVQQWEWVVMEENPVGADRCGGKKKNSHTEGLAIGS